MIPRSVAIHQPNLFPRLKVLQKIYNSDTYIFYDNVQFVRNDWQNRVFIRDYLSLKKLLLIIPVNKPHGQKSKIDEITIVETAKTVHLIKKQLYYSYCRSSYWPQIESYIKRVFSNEFPPHNLSDFLYYSIDVLLDILGSNTNMLRSSDILDAMPEDKNLHLIKLCKYANGSSYICGSGGLNYINESVFIENNIKLIVQIWNEELIGSKYDELEWKNLSFLDFWARYGIDELRNFLEVIEYENGN